MQTDVIYACYRDALRIELTEGTADVCKNDDERKDNPGKLLTSIAASSTDFLSHCGFFFLKSEMSKLKASLCAGLVFLPSRKALNAFKSTTIFFLMLFDMLIMSIYISHHIPSQRLSNRFG
jgi:hypothetical protein